MERTDAGSKPTMLTLDDLPGAPDAHELAGTAFGGLPFSVIVVHSRPGAGPRVHRHPYAELFVVESGEGTFRLGARRWSSPTGASSSRIPTCPTGSATPAPASCV